MFNHWYNTSRARVKISISYLFEILRNKSSKNLYKPCVENIQRPNFRVVESKPLRRARNDLLLFSNTTCEHQKQMYLFVYNTYTLHIKVLS